LSRSTLALFVVAILAAAAFGSYVTLYIAAGRGTSSCPSYYTGHPDRVHLFNTTFGAVTEFLLPDPQRSPNAIAVSPDGSVWFGEESLPGVANLYPNGTLVEYPWPGVYPPAGAINYSCSHRTQIWGIALWNGWVWASDSAGNQLVGLNPATGGFRHVAMSSGDSLPYSLTVGSDGALWFTEAAGQVIGRLDATGRVQEYTLPTGLRGTPEQIQFVNSTYALYSDAGEAGENNAGVFAFNPSNPTFARVGADRLLNSVTGLAVAKSGVWISEHGPAYVERYDFKSGVWTNYPTSIDSYGRGTYVYFIVSDGNLVWFNEHYGDRIGEIDPAGASMVEYSLSNPPASNLSTISNAFTIARDGARVWFTALTANRVGFADFSNPPPFAVAATSSVHLVLKPGRDATVMLSLRGHSSSPLSLLYSDSESPNGRPGNIRAASTLPQGVGTGAQVSLTATISASAATAPGSYVFDITVSDGATRYTQFLFVTVE